MELNVLKKALPNSTAVWLLCLQAAGGRGCLPRAHLMLPEPWLCNLAFVAVGWPKSFKSPAYTQEERGERTSGGVTKVAHSVSFALNDQKSKAWLVPCGWSEQLQIQSISLTGLRSDHGPAEPVAPEARLWAVPHVLS